jgi:hypothetical protein
MNGSMDRYTERYNGRIMDEEWKNKCLNNKRVLDEY